MELTRYWRAESAGNRIEVQWTGFRPRGGWILRVVLNGEVRSERKVIRFVRNLELCEGPFRITFNGLAFRHRCTIAVGDRVLVDSTQPWNPLAFAVIGAAPFLALALTIMATHLSARP